MKLLMLFGGALGFGIGLFCSRLQENSWAYSLCQASLAAYGGGWLMGWWGRVWQQGLRESVEERATKAAAIAATPSITKPAKS